MGSISGRIEQGRVLQQAHSRKVQNAMTAPWNVRVTPRWVGMKLLAEIRRPDFFAVHVRVKDGWQDAGTARSWWEAFWQGVAA